MEVLEDGGNSTSDNSVMYKQSPRANQRVSPGGFDDVSNFTRHNIKSTVKTLVSWLTFKGYGKNRQLEDIPAVELDTYMAEFYSTVKTKGGQDYKASSLKKLHTYVQRYLTGVGYPHSLLSPDFARSQMALREKIKLLTQQELQQQDLPKS